MKVTVVIEDDSPGAEFPVRTWLLPNVRTLDLDVLPEFDEDYMSAFHWFESPPMAAAVTFHMEALRSEPNAHGETLLYATWVGAEAPPEMQIWLPDAKEAS